MVTAPCRISRVTACRGRSPGRELPPVSLRGTARLSHHRGGTPPGAHDALLTSSGDQTLKCPPSFLSRPARALVPLNMGGVCPLWEGGVIPKTCPRGCGLCWGHPAPRLPPGCEGAPVTCGPPSRACSASCRVSSLEQVQLRPWGRRPRSHVPRASGRATGFAGIISHRAPGEQPDGKCRHVLCPSSLAPRAASHCCSQVTQVTL